MKTLHSKRRMFLYAMGAMGVNMLNLIIGSYLCDALMIEGFDKDISMWTYAEKTLIVAAVWSVMITVAKIIDGVIDIPLATFSDNLRTRWGRRRPAILMGLIPMMLAYVAFLNPVSGSANSMGNTVWLGLMLCLFYVFYTLTMGTYYATFSEIVDNDKDRVKLSNYKTIFDIVYFLMGYGLIPLMIGAKLNIRIIGYIFLPLALTMLIPIFMIKEPSNRKKDIAAGIAKKDDDEHVGLIKSIKYCFTNKSFLLWMVVYAVLQFGLQMFLAGQNVLYSGTMEFNGFKITLLMAAVFVPVPATLFLYNKFVKKYGLKVGLLYSLASFGVSMALMALCRTDVIPGDTLRLVVGVIASLVASLGIGCFFSISYTVPSALAEKERREKGISHPAMYFAVQGLFSGIATAIATGVVWVNLKDHGYSWLLPILVCVSVMLAFGLTFFLPKALHIIGKDGEDGDIEQSEANGEAVQAGDAAANDVDTAAEADADDAAVTTDADEAAEPAADTTIDTNKTDTAVEGAAK